MKIEERLHDAMRDYADTIEPEPGSWSKIAARFDDEPTAARAPKRGALVFAGVALALVVALVAVLLVRDDSDDTTRVATGPATDMPSRIFAINSEGHPTILDSATGDQPGGIYEVTVAEGTQIAMTPDGQDAYVVTGNGNEGCADHSILRLPVGPGARGGDQVATEATEPAVSPDGRYLAYLHCRSGKNRAEEIVLQDLVGGPQTVTAAPPGTFFIQHLEFAPDSRKVLLSLFDDQAGHAAIREIDIVSGEAAPGRELGIASGGQGWVGVRGTTGEYLGVKGTPPSVLNLAEVNRSPQGSSLFSAGPLFTVPTVPTQVVSDRSGRHVLAVVDHSLYRWSEGEASATKIADGVIGAAWIPDGSPTPVERANMPNALLAAVGGNRLAFLSSGNGSEQTSYGTYPGISSVSVTPDGKEILFAHRSERSVCGA